MRVCRLATWVRIMYGKSISAPGAYVPEALLYTYDIISELGTGGSSSVYMAWHKRLQKYLVIKARKDSSLGLTPAKRNEVEALKNLKNMYIPQIFDYLIDAKSGSYTVMEYIEGESFDKLLAAGKYFSASQIRKWYCQLAAALEELHRNNICHRDIKPANIMLTPNGSVYLIDFNNALVHGNNTKIVSRSVGYASPEQHSYFQMCESYCRGEVNITAKMQNPCRPSSSKIDWKLSDIYSLGAAMYHLYMGKRPPFETGELERVLSKLPGKTDFESSAVSAATPLSVADIIFCCMKINPKERFRSARELYAALENIQAP